MDEKDNEIQSYKNLNQKVSEELAAKREELKATKAVGQNVIEVKARLEAQLMKSNDDYRQLSNQLPALQNRVEVLNDAKEGLAKAIEEKDDEIQSLELRLKKNMTSNKKPITLEKIIQTDFWEPEKVIEKEIVYVDKIIEK